MYNPPLTRPSNMGGYPQQQTGFPAGGAPPPGQYPPQQGAPMQSGMPPQGSMGAPMQSGMPQQGQYPPQQGQYGQSGMPPQGSMGAPMQSGMPQQGQYGQMPPQGSMGAPMQSGMPGQMPQQGQYPPQQSMGAPMQSGMPGQMPGQMGQQQYGQVGMNPPLGRVSLVKGQNMSLTKAAPGLKHARIGLGWDVRQSPGAAFDLDASCFMLNGQNQVASPQHFVFYNNRQSPDGSVLQHGDNLTGMGEGDDEQVSIDLLRVPADIQRIVFVCSIYEAEQRQQNFGMVQRAFIRVVDQDTQQEIVRFDLTEEACMWNCMMFGELYRYGNEWKFKALGNGLQGGLRAAGAQFGMQLA